MIDAYRTGFDQRWTIDSDSAFADIAESYAKTRTAEVLRTIRRRGEGDPTHRSAQDLFDGLLARETHASVLALIARADLLDGAVPNIDR
jgi:hypothetical protein